MPTKITHLTSAHPRYDTRIFIKMCSSLAKKENYQVSLVVADGKGNVSKNGVAIVDVGAKSGGRLSRMTKTVKKVYQKAQELDSDIYHLHDPELLPIGLLLRMHRKKVIYDIHEDYITSILQKQYIPLFFRKIVAFCFGVFEKLVSKAFVNIIAEKYYSERFPNASSVLNYSMLSDKIETTPPSILALSQGYQWCLYTGGVSEDRGALTHLDILRADSKMAIAYIGYCPQNVYDKIHAKAEQYNIAKERVVVVGLERYILNSDILWYTQHYQWFAGVALFPKTEHYRQKELTKFFEYMYAKLPILCTNFPKWNSLIVDNNYGITAEPYDLGSIQSAINYLDTHPTEAKQMGENGKRAVEQKYNWEMEEKKLFAVYEGLL